MRIKFAVLLISILLVVGCGTTRTKSLGPIPDRPKYSISVTIDSIPSGADVFAIESDGQLGARIGTTPFVHRCGLAPRYQVWDDTKEALDGYSEAYGWGKGTFWKKVGKRKVLVLDIALAKGDHSLAVASKTIWSFGETMKNNSIALTVPLKTLTQVNREMELYLRQRAINRDQNINVYQQKDGLDSVNSGLDALIKLQGLGAFRNR
jgi:hypothetical protein